MGIRKSDKRWIPEKGENVYGEKKDMDASDADCSGSAAHFYGNAVYYAVYKFFDGKAGIDGNLRCSSFGLCGGDKI